MRFPSGDHVGSNSGPRRWVSCLTSDPSAFIEKTSSLEENTIRPARGGVGVVVGAGTTVGSGEGVGLETGEAEGDGPRARGVFVHAARPTVRVNNHIARLGPIAAPPVRRLRYGGNGPGVPTNRPGRSILTE